MPSLTLTPSQGKVGDPVSIFGAGFLPSVEVVLSIDSLGIFSEVLSDAAGEVSSDDLADKAIGTITATGNPAANDTVTLDGVVYTFKATVAATANEVKIGGTTAASLANLKSAVNADGTAGVYGSATVVHPTIGAGALTATTILFFARTGGTAGNSLATTEASTVLSFGGATLAGGAAASGVSALKFTPERASTYIVKGSDGTNSASAQFRVFTR